MQGFPEKIHKFQDQQEGIRNQGGVPSSLLVKTADKMQEFTDTEVIEKILQGNVKWFEILIRRNNPLLYKTGRSYGYSHEDTQDLMQDTFVDAYTSLSRFEGRSSFKTWITRIMLNNCYRRRQKFSFKNELSGSIADTAIPMFSKPENRDPIKAVMGKELNSVIETALANVPLEYRMTFTLREINGLNTAETAEALNISESNVKVRLNRAKTLLRKEIEKSYSAAEIFEFNAVYCDSMVERVMKIIHS
ncbi:MAG: sigma-70 family RNA polymerase sigma factor [Syntrophothermus sp.]